MQSSSASGRGEKVVEGLGGGFRFYRLSAEPLFDADGQIRRDLGFAKLVEFVWFAETGTGFPPSPQPSPVKGEGANLPSALAGEAVSRQVRGNRAQEGANLPSPLAGEGSGERGYSPLLGVREGRAIYLLYNGIPKVRCRFGKACCSATACPICSPAP